MPTLVVLVLDNPELTASVLDAWEAAGTPNVTILDSTGLGRARKATERLGVPATPSLDNLFSHPATCHRTLFAVVPQQAQADALVTATARVTGDLSRGDTGFLFTVPVNTVVGSSG